jgi:hypothetical protein
VLLAAGGARLEDRDGGLEKLLGLLSPRRVVRSLRRAETGWCDADGVALP